MANYLQEAAGVHAATLGLGIPELNARGLTWMLSRMDLRVDRLPREGEEIRARTWPSGIERMLALRDIMLETAAGEALVRAVYAYLVVDLGARRLQRPERALPELGDFDVSALGHCLPEWNFGVEGLGEGGARSAFPVAAAPRHLDDNGHVNNAHLLAWLADAVPPELRGGGLAGLRIDYSKEVLLGDRLELFHGDPVEGGGLRSVLVEARRGAEVVARAETRWTAAG